jgi:hypothetical protein
VSGRMRTPVTVTTVTRTRTKTSQREIWATAMVVGLGPVFVGEERVRGHCQEETTRHITSHYIAGTGMQRMHAEKWEEDSISARCKSTPCEHASYRRPIPSCKKSSNSRPLLPHPPANWSPHQKTSLLLQPRAMPGLWQTDGSSPTHCVCTPRPKALAQIARSPSCDHAVQPTFPKRCTQQPHRQKCAPAPPKPPDPSAGHVTASNLANSTCRSCQGRPCAYALPAATPMRSRHPLPPTRDKRPLYPRRLYWGEHETCARS